MAAFSLQLMLGFIWDLGCGGWHVRAGDDTIIADFGCVEY